MSRSISFLSVALLATLFMALGNGTSLADGKANVSSYAEASISIEGMT